MIFEKYKNCVLKNIDIWNFDKILSSYNILIQSGICKKIFKGDLKMDRNIDIFDFSDKAIIPIGLDAHVHLRYPGQEYKDKLENILYSAVKGGVGLILAMPNTNPVIDNIDIYKKVNEIVNPIANKIGIKFCQAASITKNLSGLKLVDFKLFKKHNVNFFTDDGKGIMSDDIMEKAFKASCDLDIKILQHAEKTGHRGVLDFSNIQKKLNLKPYPDNYEYEMVERDLSLLKKYKKAHYHILHVSSQKTLNLIAKAKDKGFNITCEVTPHHLFFSSDDIDISNSSFKMNPPLRTKDDKIALQKALSDGICDFIASDHAPHSYIEKKDFKTAAFGTVGLDSSLKVLITLLKKGIINKKKLVEVFSNSCAKFLNQKDYGFIKEGYKIKAAIIDTNYSKKITEKDIYGNAKNSCFLNTNLYGRVEAILN